METDFTDYTQYDLNEGVGEPRGYTGPEYTVSYAGAQGLNPGAEFDTGTTINAYTPLERARMIAAPRVGGGIRSNIRDSVNYDPLYAQALNINRSQLPGNAVIGTYPTAARFAGMQDLEKPRFFPDGTSAYPTIDGKYYSEGEKALMEPEGLLELIAPGSMIKKLFDKALEFYQGKKMDKAKEAGGNLNQSEVQLLKEKGFNIRDFINKKPFSAPDNFNANEYKDNLNLNQEEIERLKEKGYTVPPSEFLANYVSPNRNVDTGGITEIADASTYQKIMDNLNKIPISGIGNTVPVMGEPGLNLGIPIGQGKLNFGVSPDLKSGGIKYTLPLNIG